MSLSELQSILKMDLSIFETYCINNGYKFHKVDDNENDNIFGLSYVKEAGANTKYLTLNSNFFDEGVFLSYQTGSSSEYLSIKNQLEIQKFKLINTETYNGAFVKSYSNDKFNLEIFTGKDKEKHDWYEINVWYRNH